MCAISGTVELPGRESSCFSIHQSTHKKLLGLSTWPVFLYPPPSHFQDLTSSEIALIKPSSLNSILPCYRLLLNCLFYISNTNKCSRLPTWQTFQGSFFKSSEFFIDISGWTAEPINAFDLFVALGLVKCFTSSICRSANQSNPSFKHKLLAVFTSSFKLEHNTSQNWNGPGKCQKKLWNPHTLLVLIHSFFKPAQEILN